MHYFHVFDQKNFEKLVFGQNRRSRGINHHQRPPELFASQKSFWGGAGAPLGPHGAPHNIIKNKNYT